MKNAYVSYPLVPFVEDFIAKSKNGKRLQGGGKRITPGTILNYSYLLKHLLSYEGLLGVPLRIRPLTKLDKRTLVAEKNYWKRFYTNFLNYLYQTGAYDNYVGTLIKILKTAFKYIEQEKLVPVGPFYKSFHIPKEEIPIITLSTERLQFLICDKVFAQNLSAYELLIKDIFVLGCTVALRYSDLIKIRPIDIVVSSGKSYLLVRAQKTGMPTKVRLPSYALAIIHKYKRNGQKTVFPKISLTWFNKRIKLICQAADWIEPVEKMRSRRGVAKSVQPFDNQKVYRFCDSVSSHMMRRTAITTMLMNGVPEMIVKKVSGHSVDSKSFLPPRRVSPRDGFRTQRCLLSLAG